VASGRDAADRLLQQLTHLRRSQPRGGQSLHD
jgi:hypothetical protein